MFDCPLLQGQLPRGCSGGALCSGVFRLNLSRVRYIRLMHIVLLYVPQLMHVFLSVCLIVCKVS
jgi:hypothetical protein